MRIVDLMFVKLWGFFFVCFCFYKFIYLFIFGCIGSWLLRAGFSLVVAIGGYSLLQHMAFSLRWLLLLWSTGSRCVGFSSCDMWASVVVVRELQSAGSVVVAHGLSCSAACGIFTDQGSNPCPLHRRQTLNHCATREALGFLFFCFWPCHTACGILIPPPGIERLAPAVEAWSQPLDCQGSPL